ncbi:MAG TPA: ABC transporter ATP-binding protein [Gammaproteobacteria bacterium]|jgi:ABC-2 type transport system ATP-binding protein|nr:ABC transporter ATP-binding protein [Gammaproteobacteria bacterium]
MSTPLFFSQVSKSYGKRAVLHGLDLQIEAGETVGLIGINGAGKSTLLKAMLDLIAIDGGRIELFGVPHRQPSARAHAAYLAEHFVPPHYATGGDVLRFVSRLHGVEPDPVVIGEECANLELDTDALSRPAREYSKGMTQKLGLIGCLLPRRPLLILDEPMSGLDPKARALFKARLTTLKDDGVTTFFSTHLLDDVAALCDRVAILDAGRIRFHGTRADFSAAYDGATLEESFLACIGAAARP